MDYIEIEDNNGNKIEMQVVTIFKLDGYSSNYMIYSDKEKKHYYVAKFNDNNTDLDTNLSDKEYELCDSVFKEVINR